MSIASVLLLQIQQCAERLSVHPLMLRAGSGRVDPTTVARYLSSVHYLVRHTPIHLALAVESARREQRPLLVRYFEHKLSEEQGHDRWAKSDLDCLNQRFALGTVPAPCSAMEQLVQFVAERATQAASNYVAYVLFAEYLTVLIGPAWAAALQGKCDVPADALSVVTRHVELDRGHVAAAVAELEELLAGEDPAPLLDMLKESIARFEGFCDELDAGAANTWVAA